MSQPNWFNPFRATAATGATVEECEREIRAAIKFHLDGLKSEGFAIPIPSSSVEYVEVAA
jgi:predicted RNase H-like HicB family nuclease